MFDIEHAKLTLQQRITELNAEIAVRNQEIEQGMHVERELNALVAQRDEAQRRLSDHEDPEASPGS
jgi:hypothetical protein